VLGISCYSSKDLWTWHYLGLALKPERRDKSSDLYFTNVVERPKVIYNDRTKQYIMWMHIDNANYSKAAVGVAVSPNPEGPFEYVGSKRPHGCDSRDMTIFQDDDGEAYLIYSSLGNSELHIGMLQTVSSHICFTSDVAMSQ
jgi:beta-xylosidase